MRLTKGRSMRSVITAMSIALGLLIVFAPPASAATSPLGWSPPVSIDGTNRIDSLDCPSATLCVAGDASGHILSSTDPSGGAEAWSSNSADVGEAHDLLGFSCPSTTLCVGVDYFGNAVTSTEPAGGAGAWNVSGRLSIALVGVSCPTTSLCVATQQEGSVLYSTDPAGGGWETVEGVSLHGFGEHSIACPSTTLCLAADGEGKLLTTTQPTGPASGWSSPIDISGGRPITAISCPSASFCAATDTNGDVLTSSNPTGGAAAWESAPVGGEYSLGGIACPSTSMCVVASSHGDMLQSNEPAGGAGTWATVPNVDGDERPVGVASCPTTTFCAGVTSFGNVLIGSGEAKPPHTLSVNKTGAGSGEVLSSPVGIECGPICNRTFQGGWELTLNAVPDPGSIFRGWSGGGCSGTGACQVTTNADTEVTASFGLESEVGGKEPPKEEHHETTGNPPPPVPSPETQPKPPQKHVLRCHKGFRKARVHGKAKCVKVRKPRLQHRSHWDFNVTLTPQDVLNRIHGILHRYADDSTQNNNCHLGGDNPLPHVPCRHDRILPTSAFLTPSSGGFKTNCRNPYVGTYHYYRITPTGQSYHTCGPGPIPGGIGREQRTKSGEFQEQLTHQGNALQRSVGLAYQEATTSIKGDSESVTAFYQCPAQGTATPPSQEAPVDASEGVAELVLYRSRRTTISMC